MEMKEQRLISLRVTSGLNEVEAGVDAVVNDFLPVDTVFLLQVGIETRFDILNNWLPASTADLDTAREPRT